MVKEESPEALVLRALKEISKSSATAIMLDDIPAELMKGDVLNLDKWSLILKDSCLKSINLQGNSTPFCHIDPSQPTCQKMFSEFWTKKTCMNGLIRFSCIGAKSLSNYGIALLARNNVNLKHINISTCTGVTDIGLREIGLNCPKLQSLIISSCHGIEGTGLVSIAESCKNLLKVDVSSCKSLQRWSLTKLFYNCFKLEDINISNLHEVCDDEVRVLAQNAPNLFSFIAKDSPLVSDESLLLITQHCPDIDVIDISRSQFANRISDVSLLAMAQKSPTLRVLRLSGCSGITDVGLTWLSEGCKVLEELDMCGLVKISDAGLRSLGGSCHSLSHVDISNAKLVSDVGLSSLSSGCPKLKKLICHGIFLLSDPRTSAPKKGEKLQPWQSMIGVAALAAQCRSLEYLDITGCFRLNAAFRLSVASMTTLKYLNLSGCNQATSESLIAVGLGCKAIEELNFSDCGKFVNNAVIASFVDNCSNLRIVILSRCESVRGGGIRALSRCENLTKLDLTGCKSLTDIMMLPICESEKAPLLKTLIMVGVHQVTDSTLAWLSNKDHEIQLLALKGTNITKQSISAVRDRFPNSDLTYNDNFIGFWPKFRVEDRKLINKYHILREGVVKIQSRQRKMAAHRYVKQILETRKFVNAILRVQGCVRIFQAKLVAAIKRKIKNRENDAAFIITSVFRIPVALKKVQARKAYLLYVFRNKVAIKIQVHWRMYMAYCVLKRLIKQRDAYLVLRQNAAVVIQALARRYFAVNRIIRIKAMKRSRLLICERKALHIQRCYRGYLHRKKTKILRIAYLKLTKLTLLSAIKIQRKFRCFRTRKIIRLTIEFKAYRLQCAIKIQSVMRGALSRLHLAEMQTEEAEKHENWAVTKIQSHWRVKSAMILTKQLLAQRVRELQQREASAIVLQKFARAQLARKQLIALREEYLQNLKNHAEFDLWAAVKIQAVFRGMRGRTRFDELVKEKKGKWKELFDEKRQQRFFYNKLTGEIRWRMPADLLDLVPRPSCDNCCECEAQFECAVCNEIYCKECFTQVHRGGRRKDHDFRALYDYYGKRLDYGDGIFPCKWPTEVIQDEVQGWMLRVAPIRDPTAVYGVWEEYSEIAAATSDGATGKAFYFNRQSFESTYDKPGEIVQAEQMTSQFDQSHYYGYYDNEGQWVAYNTNSPGNTAYAIEDGLGHQDWSPGSPGTGRYDATGGYDYNHHRNSEEHGSTGSLSRREHISSSRSRGLESSRSQSPAYESSRRKYSNNSTSSAPSLALSSTGGFDLNAMKTKPQLTKRGILKNKTIT